MVQTLVRSPPVAPPISIKLLPLPWPQDPFMYLHNAILMCENTQVQHPTSTIQVDWRVFYCIKVTISDIRLVSLSPGTMQDQSPLILNQCTTKERRTEVWTSSHV